MLTGNTPSVTLSKLTVPATIQGIGRLGDFPNTSVVANRFCDARVRESNPRRSIRRTLQFIKMSIEKLGSPAYALAEEV
jgi:hypothetical protein